MDNLVTCRCCDDKCDPEVPESFKGAVYCINPRTFRHAWLCEFCLELEFDELAAQPARGKDAIRFDNRRDQYVEFVLNHF